jgi:hypothetical protein
MNNSAVNSMRSDQSIDFQSNARSSPKGFDDEDSDSDDSASRSSQNGSPEAQTLLPSEAFHVRFASKKFLSPWFPEVDPSNLRAETWRTWHSRREVLLTACCIISGTVLILNVAVIIAFRMRWKPDEDLGRIFKGDCKVSQRLSLSLHLVINGLSTLLFGSSNICMQLLASPTRKEIGEVHKKVAMVGYWNSQYSEFAQHSPRQTHCLDYTGSLFRPFALFVSQQRCRNYQEHF